MRQDLTAKKSFTYAGRALKAGDPFRARPGDARALRAIGHAAPAGTYQTTEAVPVVTKDVPVEKLAGKAVPATPKAAEKKVAPKKAATRKADDEADGK